MKAEFVRRWVVVFAAASAASCGGGGDEVSGPGGGSQPATVASVSVGPASATVPVGGTVQLTATLRSSSGASITGKAITWSSGNPSLATVSGSGLVTGVAIGGPVSITATSDGVTGTAAITVTPAPVASVNVTPTTATVFVGATTTLTATVRDAAGAVLSDRAVTWTTSNAAVANVSPTGVVTGIAAGGPVTITATAESRSATATITVLAVPIASITIAPPTSSLGVGQSVQLSAILRDANNNVITGRSLTWRSSNVAVASVSSTGLVTGIAIGGPVTISAASDGRTGSAQVTVVAAVNPLALGNFHSCYLKADGTAYCWGDNTYGQLGDGTTTRRLTPTPVSGGQRFTALAGGNFHTCGLNTAGAVYCWGRNTNGQLGDGTLSTRTTPTVVSGGLTFTAITASGDYVSTLQQINGGHTCGISQSGTTYCWGYGPSLGHGSSGDRLTPTPVSGSLQFTMIEAGNRHTCGLTASGSAYCWGTNSSGQLGDGSTISRQAPVAVISGTTFSTISAGGWGHTCAATLAGVAYCWGDNGSGELGNALTTPVTSPAQVTGGHTFGALSTAGWLFTGHTCGLTTGGTAMCWGNNTDGELGNGGTSRSSTPVPVSGSRTYMAIAAQWIHTCAVTAQGEVYCWGLNSSGELGDGTTTSRSAPVRVPIP